MTGSPNNKDSKPLFEVFQCPYYTGMTVKDVHNKYLLWKSSLFDNKKW